MKNSTKKVSRSRKFIGSLALVLALSNIGGCALNTKKVVENDKKIVFEAIPEEDHNDIHEHNHDHEEIEKIVEEAIQEIDSEEKQDEDDEIILDYEEDDIEISQYKPSTTTKVNEKLVLDSSIPNIGDYNGNSIVQALRLAGYPSDYKYRCELAAKLGIENYRGTAEQNMELIRLLRGYYENYDFESNSASNEEEKTLKLTKDNNGNQGNNGGSEDNETPSNDDHHDDEKKHNHNYKVTKTEMTSIDDENHKVTKTYSCSCGKKYTKSSVKKHTYGKEETKHENETDDGYDLVTFKTCSGCDHVYEVSRKHVEIECEHKDTRTEVRIENETEESHDEVTYSICNKCKEEKKIKTKHVTHEFKKEETPRKENANGCEYEEVYYEVAKCGEHTYERPIESTRVQKDEHSYGVINTRIKPGSETEEGHILESYKTCAKCGKIEVISSEEITHGYVKESTPRVENVNGCEYDEVYYEVSSCGTHTYERPIESTRVHKEEHSYGDTQTRIKDETEENHTLETYKRCPKCGKEEIISTETITHEFVKESTPRVENVNGCEYEEVFYEVATCGTHTYERAIESTRVQKDEHSYGSILSRIKNETEEGHTLEKYKICSKCDKEEIVSTEDVTHEFVKESTPRKENVNGCEFDEVFYEVASCGTHTYERAIESTRVHKEEHTLGTSQTRIKNETEEGHTLETYKVCSKCNKEEIISTVNETHTFTNQPAVKENTKACGTYESVVYKTATCESREYKVEVSRNTVYATHDSSVDDYTLVSTTTTDLGNGQHKTVEQRKCNCCGKEYEITNTLGHTLSGDIRSEYTKIEGNNAQHLVTKYQYCDDCKQDIVVASATKTDHHLTEEKDGKVVTYTCSDCGYSYTVDMTCTHNWGMVANSYDKATQTVKYYCPDCKEYKTEPHTHEFNIDLGYDEGYDITGCICGEEDKNAHTIHSIDTVTITETVPNMIYHVVVYCNKCKNEFHEQDYIGYENIPEEYRSKSSFTPTSGISTLSFDSASYDSGYVMPEEEDVEEEQLPIESEKNEEETVEVEETETEETPVEDTSEESEEDEDDLEVEYNEYLAYIKEEEQGQFDATTVTSDEPKNEEGVKTLSLTSQN